MNFKCLYTVIIVAVSLCGGLMANPIRQDTGADGIVSVEAEHYDELIELSGGTFVLTGSKAGFTGVQGMEATGGGNANAGYLATNPRMEYLVDFVKTGTHYVWIRAWGASGNDDSCHAGLDAEENTTSDRMSGWNANYIWSNDTMDPDPATFEVPSVGVHRLTIWQRENGLIIDKIVLTTNPNYTPTGDGPPESSRGPRVTASGAYPEDGADDVIPDIVLAWVPSEVPVKHNVYFGANFDDVNAANVAALVGQSQDANTYDPEGNLAFGQTYYWRVDEVNVSADRTVHPGSVWSFTAEPLAYPVTTISATASSSNGDSMGPENTVDGSGLSNGLHGTTETDMWLSGPGDSAPFIQYEFDKVYKLHEMAVWNSNQTMEMFLSMGVKDVTIEVSTDGTTWTVVEGVSEFNKAPGTPDYAANTIVDLSGILAKYVKINILSGHSILPAKGLSEVQFTYIPVNAREPQPALGTKADGLDVVLKWRPGREAATHEVLFSTDMVSVLDGSAVIGTVTGKSLDLSDQNLQYGTIYFWQVNEVNEAGTPARYMGDVWVFTTPTYMSVDDFESYDNLSPNRPFQTWLDGIGYSADEYFSVAYGGNGTGAGIGHDIWTITSPYFGGDIMETGITLSGGKQSMPLYYNNSKAPHLSESSSAPFALPSNWKVGGPDVLSLSFRGNAPAFLEQTDGHITMSGAGNDIWNAADQFRYAFKNLNGDGSIVAKVNSLIETDPWVKAGVMIRETSAPGSAFAGVYMTGTNGVRYQARLNGAGNAVSDSGVLDGVQQTLTEPVWLKIERQGNQFNGYYSTDGAKWTAMAWNPQIIGMGAQVTIGLAVTSHVSGTSTVAEFSDVSTTGNVTGAYQVEAVGVAMPANDGEPLYVVIEDSAGKKVTVTHPDPEATIVTDWEEWLIPLADLASLNLANIKSVTLGVGSGNGQAGGQGSILIDNLRVGKPWLSDEISLEAEVADILGQSWHVNDDPTASGGQNIGSEDGVDGDENNFAPGADWIATYNFNATGGEYKCLLLAQESTTGSDSFWVRITTAASLNFEDPDQPGSGWVRFNGINAPDGWAWDEVHSDDHAQAVAIWTLAPGAHVLEIAKREDGTLLDAIKITNKLD